MLILFYFFFLNWEGYILGNITASWTPLESLLSNYIDLFPLKFKSKLDYIYMFGLECQMPEMVRLVHFTLHVSINLCNPKKVGFILNPIVSPIWIYCIFTMSWERGHVRFTFQSYLVSLCVIFLVSTYLCLSLLPGFFFNVCFYPAMERETIKKEDVSLPFSSQRRFLFSCYIDRQIQEFQRAFLSRILVISSVLIICPCYKNTTIICLLVRFIISLHIE